MRTPAPLDASPEPRTSGEELLAGIIHQLRQPLTGIACGLELVARALGPAVTGLEEWGIVRAQLGQLEGLLRSCQDLADPRPRAPVPYAVEPVLRQAITLAQFRVKGLGARFALVVPDRAPVVRGSPGALLHATANLLANAIDAVEAAGDAGRVEVRLLCPAGGRVEVRVSDEGQGIPAEVASHLFEPGVTTKDAGSGLGLHIARTMLERTEASLRLVPPGASGRRPWARTEFAIELAAAEHS